jgi:hypothetical protein
MTKASFEMSVGALGLTFARALCTVVAPPVLESSDVAGAFAAGFVNPYASGYSLDTILCALILFAWIAHERVTLGVKHRWIAIPMAIVPGVATTFATYLIIRSRQKVKVGKEL